ncbi:MAG: hypothetical protein E3J96_01810 [Sulfurovum sp.]|nr:MAG: hypothetical protein E3J96_01810 [Sulfurovum sp.]
MLLHQRRDKSTQKTKGSKGINGIYTLMCQTKRYFQRNETSEYQDTRIRISVNAHGMIMLEGNIDGKRHRLSTRTKATFWLLAWYSCHASSAFLSLYEKRFDTLSQIDTTFREYGTQILENTQNYRNAFTQKEELSKFRTLCETFGDMALNEIKASHILKWQNNTNKAPKTILNYRGTLNIIFKYAVYAP